MGDLLFRLFEGLAHELMLFAAVGFTLGGLDDLLVDILYLGRRIWRRLFVYSRYQPMTTATLPLPADDREMAIFVPAWDEAEVIGAMLRGCLSAWGTERYRIFAGAYPNDRATITAIMQVAADEARIIPVITDRPGPTTKGDCLNALWRAMLRQEAMDGASFKAIVLHDAEDVVHPDSLRLLSVMVERFDLVQLPVLPLIDQNSRWIAGHYACEFAEAHGKYLSVREAVGAAMPSAGVGCAFARDAMGALTQAGGDGPFDPDCLTEDYELGLRIAEQGGKGIFVRMRDREGALVCTREHFPDTLDSAIRQKARWMVGIALAGWDRLGWHGGPAEHWMRLRDRRAAVAALVLSTAYLVLLLHAGLAVAWWLSGRAAPGLSPILSTLLTLNAMLLAWRMAWRMAFVTSAYGWREGVRSVPRAFIANLIAILSARRAMSIYFRLWRGAPIRWDKTRHRFPAAARVTP